MELENKSFIDKYTFKRTLKDIESLLLFQDRLDMSCNEFAKSTGYVGDEVIISYPTLIDTTITLLENAMHDTNGIIYTWIYDCKFGRNNIGDKTSEYYFLDKITNENELYDYLCVVQNLNN